jgi:hypothetical protein
MSPLSSVRGTGGSINDTAVKQNQNTLTHPYNHTKGEFVVITGATGDWTVPDGVTKICVVCIAAGGGGSDIRNETGGSGGGGGGLSYGNNITVKPGDSLEYNVGEGGTGGSEPDYKGEDGGHTWIKDSAGNYLVRAYGGEGGKHPWVGTGGEGGNPSQGSAVHGGGDGGRGNYPFSNLGTWVRSLGGGGGGAGGYSGTGGGGGYGKSPSSPGYYYDQATDGSGGAGGGGMVGHGGGGTGLYGEGSSGVGGEAPGSRQGEGGSPGFVNTESAEDANEPGASPALNTSSGGGNPGTAYGGGLCGGGGASGGDFYPPDYGEGEPGSDGGLRIVWGCGVSFPDDAKGNYPNP